MIVLIYRLILVFCFHKHGELHLRIKNEADYSNVEFVVGGRTGALFAVNEKPITLSPCDWIVCDFS